MPTAVPPVDCSDPGKSVQNRSNPHPHCWWICSRTHTGFPSQSWTDCLRSSSDENTILTDGLSVDLEPTYTYKYTHKHKQQSAASTQHSLRPQSGELSHLHLYLHLHNLNENENENEYEYNYNYTHKHNQNHNHDHDHHPFPTMTAQQSSIDDQEQNDTSNPQSVEAAIRTTFIEHGLTNKAKAAYLSKAVFSDHRLTRMTPPKDEVRPIVEERIDDLNDELNTDILASTREEVLTHLERALDGKLRGPATLRPELAGVQPELKDDPPSGSRAHAQSAETETAHSADENQAHPEVDDEPRSAGRAEKADSPPVSQASGFLGNQNNANQTQTQSDTNSAAQAQSPSGSATATATGQQGDFTNLTVTQHAGYRGYDQFRRELTHALSLLLQDAVEAGDQEENDSSSVDLDDVDTDPINQVVGEIAEAAVDAYRRRAQRALFPERSSNEAEMAYDWLVDNKVNKIFEAELEE